MFNNTFRRLIIREPVDVEVHDNVQVDAKDVEARMIKKKKDWRNIMFYNHTEKVVEGIAKIR